MSDKRETGRGLLSAFSLFIAAVSAVGLTFAAVTLIGLDRSTLVDVGPAFWLIAALIVLGELRPLFTAGSNDQNGVATSTTFVFALLLHWGLPVAVMMQAVATVIADVTKRKAWWRTAFNVAQYSLSYGAAAGVLMLLGRTAAITSPTQVTGQDLPAIALAALAYFVVNDGLVSVAVALHEEDRFWQVFRGDLGYQGLTTAALLALSPLVVVVLERSVGLVPLLLLPLFAVYKNASVSVEREWEALHDPLTQLPNRKLMLSQVAEAIAEGHRLQHAVGFFLLDVDRFKDVNDTLGHHVGDELLQHVAARIASVLRPEDTVGRLGGDEFAVLLPTVRDRAAAEEIATRIRAAIAEPFSLHGVHIDLDASVGIALFPEHATEAELLHQRADVAMYLAKETRNGCEMYSTERDPHSTQRLGLFGQLRRAIDEGELVLHYQPKIGVATGAVVGVEALVRWQHPERGLLAPDAFVPLAEQTGLMRSLTRYVLDAALLQAAEWARGGRPMRMSVNISARDLHDSRFCDEVRESLERAGIPASLVELELTERVVMADPVRALENLRALASLGVRLSLDDFGTGYSSLAYLKRLPVAEIKIDKSFVLRMDVDAEDAMIVRSTIDLAHGLGLHVLAEGVETANAWHRLGELGCDAVQGYLISRPLPADQLADWLQQRTSATHLQVVGDGGRAGATG